MTKVVFTMSEAQADEFPDWETRELTVETDGNVHLVYEFLHDEDSNVLAHFTGSYWLATQDTLHYSDIAILPDTPHAQASATSTPAG